MKAFILICNLFATTLFASAVKVQNLTCEYLVNPIGIDTEKPRLSWAMESDNREVRQAAYQILVSSTQEKLAENRGDLWNSGKVASNQSIQVEYAGLPLHSRDLSYWKVRIWDKAGKLSEWSNPAFWSMGLLSEDDWKGKWIGRDEVSPSNTVKVDVQTLPARYLRREFIVEKKIRRATTYACGLGFFDLFMNGEKITGHMMDPALSDYHKALYYNTFDVTAYLQKGTNSIGVILGNGRFFAPRLITPALTMNYGYPKMLLQTDIVYEDGTTSQVITDENWKLTTHGPIRANSEYDGEEYDARMEMDNWNRAGFNDAAWEKVQCVTPPGGTLRAQMIEPMQVTQAIKPVSITNPAPGIFVIDMGQNFYGTVRMKASGSRGTKVQLVSAYSLLPDGMLKTADNRGAHSTDTYIFKGDGVEAWNPRFKGQGYRRIQVTGFPGIPNADNFEGLVIHTDMKQTGGFECSNDLVNRIHTAMVWGFRMFLRSAPLDPDRDERQAWMGDPSKDSESEAYNFGVASFYTKWMDDVARSQRKDGTIPDVSMNWEWGNSVEWPSVFTIIPDWFQNFYADTRLIETHYDQMKRWVLTIDKIHHETDGTLKSKSYADWCDTYSMDGKGGDSGKTPQNLVSTAYHYNNCRIMARAAGRLNRVDDQKLFNQMAQQIKEAFNKRFFDPSAGKYQSGTQCSYLLPLAFGIVPSEYYKTVAENLVNDILITHKGHLSVGLIGMQWLMQQLTEIGRPDVAWTIATQTTRPGWGYMIGKGATTIWERWDTDTRDPGMNSEALLILAGNLDAWFYQTLAGINYDNALPGFSHIIIKPQLVGDLKWVKAHHDCLYGSIVSNWRREGQMLNMEITIPANTTATIYLPAKYADGVTESGKPAHKAKGVQFVRMENNNALYTVGSGSYRFQSVLPDIINTITN